MPDPDDYSGNLEFGCSFLSTGMHFQEDLGQHKSACLLEWSAPAL